MNNSKSSIAALKAVLPAITTAVIEALSIALDALEAVADDHKEQKPTLKLAPVEAAQQNTRKKFDEYPATLTIMQAAQMMDMTYPNMHKLARSKVTPFRQVGKKKRLVFKEDLLAFFEERKGKSLLAEYDEEFDEAV